jgi:hypothetical protein
MRLRQGIGTVVVTAAGALMLGATVGTAWAQAGVTDKIGQTRVTTVPAPLPQAVPAGQGVRPSTVAKPSFALPSAPVAPTTPNAPDTAVLSHKAAPPPATALPSTALTRPDAEVAPVAPSLAAHGLPITAMAAPAAGLTGDAAAAEKKSKPKVEAPKPRQAARAGLRKPADVEPRLRPEPVPGHKPVARVAQKASTGKSVPPPVLAKADRPAPLRSTAQHAAVDKAPKAGSAAGTARKAGARVNDGSRP